MMKFNLRRSLAVILTAAMALTAVPGTVFAGELTDELKDNAADVQLADVDLVDSDSEDIIIEPVSEDEVAGLDAAGFEAANETVDLDGDPTPANWHEPVDYTLGKKISDTVYNHEKNTDEEESQGLYYDRKFYRFCYRFCCL